jgi:uncharacterized membrane protein
MTVHAPHPPPARLRAIPWAVVLLTSVAVAVYFPGQYLTDTLAELARRDTGLAGTYADRPAVIQAVFYVHIVSAGLALLIGGFQFSRRLRGAAPRAHRWIGRGYVVSVLIGGATGLIMAFFSSAAFIGLFGFGTLAVLWIWTTWRGYRTIRAGRVAEHQAWMIRSYALTYAAPTLRMWLILLMAVQLPFGVDGAVAAANAYAPVPFLCWLPNVVVAEYIIRRKGLPSLIRTAADDGRVAHLV